MEVKLNQQGKVDSHIVEATGMANGKASRQDNSYAWTIAFMTAMNWLLYQDGERQLSREEIKDAEELYGEVTPCNPEE